MFFLIHRLNKIKIYNFIPLNLLSLLKTAIDWSVLVIIALVKSCAWDTQSLMSYFLVERENNEFFILYFCFQEEFLNKIPNAIEKKLHFCHNLKDIHFYHLTLIWDIVFHWLMTRFKNDFGNKDWTYLFLNILLYLYSLVHSAMLFNRIEFIYTAFCVLGVSL